MRGLSLLLLLALASPAAAETLFSEDFESYALGSNLTGQNGWFTQYGTAPLNISSGGALGGQWADALGDAAPGNLASHEHLLSRNLDPSEETVFSGRIYVPSPTHNVYVGLSNAGSTFLQFSPILNQLWLQTSAGNEIYSPTLNQVFEFELVLNGVDEVGYGRFRVEGTTTWTESSHLTFSAIDIAQVDRVRLFTDDRNPSYLGAAYDDLHVEASAVVPEPGLFGLLALCGLGLLGRREE